MPEQKLKIACQMCGEESELVHGDTPYRWSTVHRKTSDCHDSAAIHYESTFYLCEDCLIKVTHPELESRPAQLAASQTAHDDEILKLNDIAVAKVRGLQTQVAGLVEFTKTVIRGYCWGSSLDGMEIQDLAERHGFVAKHTATTNDVDEESDFEVGDVIYKFTQALASQPESDTSSQIKCLYCKIIMGGIHAVGCPNGKDSNDN
jgi:hypothetical protein